MVHIIKRAIFIILLLSMVVYGVKSLKIPCYHKVLKVCMKFYESYSSFDMDDSVFSMTA